MFRHEITRAPVVDAHEVKVPGIGIFRKGSVKQNDRNLRIRKGADDSPVCCVLSWRILKWRKEDTSNAPLNVLRTQLPRALLGRILCLLSTSPEECMRSRNRRLHHSLTNRLEYLSLAKVRNQNSEH